MEQLKACPFCGNTVAPTVMGASELSGCDCYTDSTYCVVVCSMNETSPVPLDYWHNGCGASGGYRPTADEAIAAWNRRAPSKEDI